MIVYRNLSHEMTLGAWRDQHLGFVQFDSSTDCPGTAKFWALDAFLSMVIGSCPLGQFLAALAGKLTSAIFSGAEVSSIQDRFWPEQVCSRQLNLGQFLTRVVDLIANWSVLLWLEAIAAGLSVCEVASTWISMRVSCQHGIYLLTIIRYQFLSENRFSVPHEQCTHFFN